MRNEYLRYFIGFLVAIGLIILVVFLIFSGGGDSKKKTDTPKSLSSYADTDAVVRMTIRGKINAPQNHQQVTVTVGNDATTYQQISGYNGDVVNSQTTGNTIASYNEFLRALALAGYLNGDNSKDLSNSAGFCPLGQLYTFELEEDGNQIQRYWATSCGGTKTYLGNLGLTVNLFQLQVPNYSTLTANLTF